MGVEMDVVVGLDITAGSESGGESGTEELDSSTTNLVVLTVFPAEGRGPFPA